ncbi:MAG: S24 family peptidase [Chloroflexi bacterium]|nr:S24 family peptidase [Chloroflexota bacterium]
MNDPEETYFWLRREEPRFPAALQSLVKRLHDGRANRRYSTNDAYLNRIKFVADGVTTPWEQAAARLECAWAAWRYLAIKTRVETDLDEAIALLDQANLLHIQVRHTRGMAHWMRASFLRHDPQRLNDAIVGWQLSLNAFQLLAGETIFTAEDAAWYLRRCDLMRQIIENGVAGAPAPRRPAQAAGARIHSTRREARTPVVGAIPAGGWEAAPQDGEVQEAIELRDGMDRFIIDQLPHLLYDLRGQGRQVTLVNGDMYFILRVHGDSMNQANIDNCDYVLIHQQPAAVNGDIVAVEVFGVDHEATLKTYSAQRDAAGNITFVLSPNSSNPRHRPLVVASDQDFAIRGVAIGVFKAV